MQDIRRIIDSKFEAALEAFLGGSDSIRSSKPVIGPVVELVALDSQSGPDSRCLLSRNSLGSPGLAILGVDILSWGVEIPRMEGDRRLFEELPPEAIQGNIFGIGIKDGVIDIQGDIRRDWLSLEGLSGALSRMRVVQNIPLPQE